MKKFFILIFFLTYSLSSDAHMAHYNKFNKIEMEILKDGEVIGYNYYFFKKDGDKTTVKNQIDRLKEEITKLETDDLESKIKDFFKKYDPKFKDDI